MVVNAPSQADAFAFPGDERGVLCVHGFTGTPFEMRPLGERLAARGMTVVGPLLPGHGRTPAHLDETRWPDWYAGLDRALTELRSRCRTVAVVGLSMGGLLTLHAARMRGHQIAAIASLAAPLWLPRRAGVAPVLARLSERTGRPIAVPKPNGTSDIRDAEMRRKNPTMPAMPMRALASLLDLCRMVSSELGLVDVPTFIAHGRHDHTAPPACARVLERRLGTRDKKRIELPRSYHVITLDVERELLADEVASFLEERMRG